MTPDQKGSLPIRVEKLFYDLQDRVFSDVVRRIKKTGEITSTADYQINKLLILGNSTEFIESELERLLDASDPEIWELYDKVSNWEYVRYRDAYEQINGHFTPLEENEQIQQWSQAIVKQTQNEITNITRSLGMTVNMGGKAVFTPLAEYYQKYLDRACMDIVTGSFSYNTVLRRVVNEMTASGIKSVDYASGWCNRVPVAVRRAVMTGVSQLSAKINEQVAKDLGTDTYEVTWHSGHRPSHWWGGEVYTYKELESVCELGSGDGLCGWNCRHSYMAFIDGYSVLTYSPEELQELEAKEQETKEYGGRQYTPYQAQQAQRQMETRMRSQRAKVKQLQRGDGSPDDIMAAKTRYLNTLHQYQGFSKKMGIPEQMERVYMDGLGRCVNGNISKKSIVNASTKGYNRYRKTSNAGTAFSGISEPMQLKHVRSIIENMPLDYDGIKINIVRDQELIGIGFTGWTNPNGKEVQLYPDAFASREELVKTLGHERVHVEQIRLFGPSQNHEEGIYYEQGPRFSEQYWWDEYRKKVNYHE